MKKVLALLAVVGLVIGCFATVGIAEEAASAATEGPKYGKNVGDPAKPFMIKDVDGKEVDTAMLTKDGRAIFVFVNGVCSQCRNEMARIHENKDKFLEKAKVYLVAVDMTLDRSKVAYEPYLKDFKLLHDSEFKFGPAVGINSTPGTLILDKGGKILFTATGFKESESLKAMMAALK